MDFQKKEVSNISESNQAIKIRDLNAFYGDFQALEEIETEIPENKITAVMGPSGCGKSTFIKCLNRILETTEEARIDGEVIIDGTNIYDPGVEVLKVRKKVGMVFQEPNPLPMSIRENLTYGPKTHGHDGLDGTVKESLKAVGLWKEVKDRLETSAFQLSGGQQQRLCIARALSIEPKIILMDEPTSSLDPVSSEKIEQLLTDLRDDYGLTIVVVTHNVHQAKRLADHVLFLYMGELLESGEAEEIFNNPDHQRTLKYINGDI